MKNLISYYYHIYPDKIFRKNEIYYFYIDDMKYFLVPFKRNVEELNSLVEVTNTLFEMNILIHTFIKNINNDFFIKHLGNNYVLLRQNFNEEAEEINLIDIVRFNNLLNADSTVLYKNDWKNRWISQVDKFEAQVSEYNKEYPILLGCFDYYIGLAENAISYLDTVEMQDNVRLYLSHKRIAYPVNYGVIYNPLNLMFDNKTRDVAEYIKTKFFEKTFEFEELEKYITENKDFLTLSDIQYLYARLMYPTYYFDFFEQIILGDKEDDELNKIMDLSSDYEIFLLDVFNYLKPKYNLEPIDWIVNRD